MLVRLPVGLVLYKKTERHHNEKGSNNGGSHRHKKVTSSSFFIKNCGYQKIRIEIKKKNDHTVIDPIRRTQNVMKIETLLGGSTQNKRNGKHDEPGQHMQCNGKALSRCESVFSHFKGS